jgi:hypothetical protein
VQINVSLHQILVQINVISINSSAKKHNRKASLATDLQQNRGHVAHDLQQKFIAIATDLRQKSCIFAHELKQTLCSNARY